MTADEIILNSNDVLPKLSPSLQKKVIYSVELLRKAEHLALAYDADNGYYLAFSGGKDSQALYHVAQLAGVKFKAHMNATSVDPPDVLRFVRRQYPSVELIPPKDSIYNIAVQRKILPTKRVRWCCAEFKENAGAGKVTLIGIRHAESSRRAKRNEVEISSRKFSGTLEQLDEYRDKKKKRKSKGVNITNTSSERILGCISGKETLLISPIIHWTEDDVWAFLNSCEIPRCKLYDEGWKRLGCICCPMSQRKQKLKELARYPHVKRNWIKAIKEIRRGGYSKKNISGGTSNKNNYPPAFYATNKLWIMGGGTLPTQTPNIGFSDCSLSDGLTEEQKEDAIAEAIFDWWISGKSYKRWYADKYLQQKLSFN